jgi:urease accessory protein
LETLVQAGTIANAAALEHWLTQELQHGAIRLEAAVMAQAYVATLQTDLTALRDWNQWLSAFRETEELRQQSWQMGRSMVRLLQSLEVPNQSPNQSPNQAPLQPLIEACGEPCNFAIAFGIAAAVWQIDRTSATLGYLQSWVTNLINAGVRLIPLGQTQGQQTLLSLYPQVEATMIEVLDLKSEAFGSCSWGLSIASMTHETLYSRLFRS